MKARCLFISLMLFCTVSLIFSQAVIVELAGTVELKHAGSAVWVNAVTGQRIEDDTSISTGFRSMAIIALGNSTILVRPLTRLTLRELSQLADSERIEVNLQVGRVRADIRPPAGGRADATFQSPSAVASVRGTVFEFDTLNLQVSEGTVEFTGATMLPVLVDSGRFSSIDETNGRAALPAETSIEDLRPELPIASDNVLTSDSAATAAAAERTLELAATIGF